VASALWALTESRASGVFNICSGLPVTMRQLMETIGEIAGGGELIRFGALPYREWDPPFICGDNRRLRAATNWQPRFSTHSDGLAQTVTWWKTQRNS
jgi:nucleoside-diphosphate-sugar epimerase